MFRVFLLAGALSACVPGCAPVHRLAHPAAKTPTWALEADFALVCASGAATAGTFNTGSPWFLPALSSFVGLILADTWAAR